MPQQQSVKCLMKMVVMVIAIKVDAPVIAADDDSHTGEIYGVQETIRL